MKKPLYPELPILVVDDEEPFLVGLKATLRVRGITNVECCQDSRDVMPLLGKKKILSHHSGYINAIYPGR